MRKVETSSKDFRENLNEIAQLMAYEVFRDVPLQKIIVLIPIIRAGLGMIEGIQRLVPTSKIAHVGLYRNEETLEPVKYYAKKTENMEESIVIVVDPMLATGGSASKAIEIAKE
ncbi:hypothetical protein FQR65_LT17014 [Abscondita terminalis]|nr:hypothetical protein FQR65_LT17014 [Abscondita terminalis]